MLRLGVNAAYWQKIGWLAAPFALTPAAMDRWKSAQAVRRSFACGLIHQPGQGKRGGRTARILAGADASALSYLTPEHSIDLSLADFFYGFECAGGVSDWLVKFLACEHAWQQAEQADEAAEQTGQQHIKVAHLCNLRPRKLLPAGPRFGWQKKKFPSLVSLGSRENLGIAP